jgi:hypothetical protein
MTLISAQFASIVRESLDHVYLSRRVEALFGSLFTATFFLDAFDKFVKVTQCVFRIINSRLEVVVTLTQSRASVSHQALSRPGS